uniref:PARP-type domain-containing protein n=1 Tax=viral metagenome TaxID=1070528 RepID=A0A6H1Z824_9ZZZZ
MGKYKTAKCVICHKPIFRHDELRLKIKVGEGANGQGVFKLVHLSCSQKETNVI